MAAVIVSISEMASTSKLASEVQSLASVTVTARTASQILQILVGRSIAPVKKGVRRGALGNLNSN